MPDLTPVTSSNIEAIGFDEEAGELLVQFKNGATWAYAGCCSADYEALANAPSVGSHFAREVRPNFEGRQL